MVDRPKREGIMLAYPTEEGRIIRLGKEFFAQPKYNGERCRVEWFHGEPVLLSSYGNQFKFLEHIEACLRKVRRGWGEIPFDGEIYRHGWNFSKIHSVASRKENRHADCEGLQFHIFDIQDSLEPQWKRIHRLQEILEDPYPALRQVDTVLTDRDGWTELAVDFVDDGYEGIILRSCQSYYRPKRDVGLLKFKPTEIDEYLIVDTIEAIDKHGQPKNTLGAFVVIADDLNKFKVGAGKLTHDLRDKIWEQREKIKGQILVVKHEKLKTVNNIPVAAVAVKVKGGIA